MGRDRNLSAREHRAFAVHAWTACLAGVIALAALLTSIGDAPTLSAPSASPLVAADPEPNALLATPPDRISLTFTEPVDFQSANIRVLRAGGGEALLSQLERQGDNASPTRISVRPQGTMGIGDYTVVWSAKTADDGEVIAGAYPFRTGVVTNPGAARLDGEGPAPWAVVLRWLVFLGTSPAAGGGTPGSPVRSGVMAIGALAALLATGLLPFLNRLLSPTEGPQPPLAVSLWAMPLGWWIQLVALFILALLCLGVLASGRATARVPVSIIWVGLGSGLAALLGLSLTAHALSLGAGRALALALAASTQDSGAILLSTAHQSSTALWLSGLLYLAAGWREISSDVVRFRRVRWIGGALLGVSIVTGLASTWGHFPSHGAL